MTQSKVIGITGGAGAGKSTILAYILEKYDAEVISADEVGRALMEPGGSVYDALCAYYGTVILTEDGRIDRPSLAAIGLKDAESQAVLNQIEHPLIRDEILRMIKGSKKSVVFLEAALLKEGSLVPVCDEVWVVTASEETRIARLMKDRGYTEEYSRTVLSRQLTEEEFSEIADVLIVNDGELSEVWPHVDREMKRIGAKKHEITKLSKRKQR
ncbi:MAG: dephospho-CoA kinase [Lachnospiraceae bacterium]|nr:dephospho-CoA kinase [Lachnospiraceae bacterium]